MITLLYHKGRRCTAAFLLVVPLRYSLRDFTKCAFGAFLCSIGRLRIRFVGTALYCPSGVLWWLRGTDLNITEEKKGPVSIVRVCGAVHAEEARELKNRLDRLLDSGRTKLLINLTPTEYLSAAGLQVLREAAEKVRGLEGKMVLCASRGHAQEVLQITGWAYILNTSPDEASGLAEF